ncbi:MAG TPA: penicillin-binding protein 1C [Acetobacteraceae bacterium]|nr:penicillin-binding protein 1C [Acetobacteraceae bacterium]
MRTEGKYTPPPLAGGGSFFLGLLPSLVFLLAALAAALDYAFPPDLSRLDSVGTEILDRQDRPLALLPAPGGVWRFHVDTAPPLLTNLLIAVEDRRFWYHPGVDPIALARATAQFLRSGHVVSGGSTLAMQAARLLEARPRTLRSKLIEMARALQLEARYGRQGVLDIWLTLAPFGGNLEGVRAGSLAWFGVPPEALEPAQAALLVAIPRRPERLRPDRHAVAATAVRDRVLAIGLQAGLFDATATPVPTARVPLPLHAPQLAASLPRVPRIRTTLDLPLQTALERLGREQLGTLPQRASLALLVADAREREIRALYPGDWRNQDRAGAIDLTLAVRSPGSALKPFIYAMAFADGIAAPDTVLPDLPRRFGGYAPENFDRGFAGSITAAEALRRSLNLPAVALLDRVGPLRFAATLRFAGATLRLPRGADPSLPLALGGDGITLRDAAALYAALATDGTGGKLRLLAGEPAPRPDFLAASAAHAVADVLTRPLPEFGPRGIAWKTGTSWGGRDAWAFGFDSRHVVAVWIGRPDGTPLPGATGASLALPLLSRVFDLLPEAPRTVMPVQEQHPHKTTAVADALHLLFPPPGAVLSADGPVTIRVMGGRRPMTFLVDGAPLPADHIRREAAWQPSGPGFYRLTVLDADGSVVRASVQVGAKP